MSLLQRFLGIGEPADGPASESEIVRRIAAELDQLPTETAHYLAAFAYVLARVAHADLRLDESEVEAMVSATTSLADLGEAQARLVVEIAQSGARELGGSQNYLVTREFKKISNREQRLALVECLYAVSAADGTISTTESAEVVKIAEELGITRNEANALRSQWKEHLAEFQALRKRSQ